MRTKLLSLAAVFGLLALAVPASLVAEEDGHSPAEHSAEEGEKPHSADGENGHDEEHGHDEEEAGVSMTPAADLALWSVVVFVVLLAVLWKSAWGPIVDGLDTRESNIRGDIAAAQADRQKAAQERADIEARLKSVEDEIREMRSEARAAADKMKQEAVTAGKEEAAALVEKAKGEIEQDRRQAQEQLKNELVDKIVFAAEQIVGRKMNDGDEQRLADEALVQFADAVN